MTYTIELTEKQLTAVKNALVHSARTASYSADNCTNLKSKAAYARDAVSYREAMDEILTQQGQQSW